MDIQLFAAAHYGNEGELRFGPGIFSDEIHATVESFGASLDFPTQVLELGLNLRIAL